MSSARIARSTGRFVLIFATILAIALACAHLLPTPRHRTYPYASSPAARRPTVPPPTASESPTGSYLRAEGRWKVIRASLGLPPLSDRIRIPATPASAFQQPTTPLSLTASRFDLRRKRSIEERESRRTVPLYFAPDALEPRTISLEEFFKSSRVDVVADMVPTVQEMGTRELLLDSQNQPAGITT